MVLFDWFTCEKLHAFKPFESQTTRVDVYFYIDSATFWLANRVDQITVVCLHDPLWFFEWPWVVVERICHSFPLTSRRWKTVYHSSLDEKRMTVLNCPVGNYCWGFTKKCSLKMCNGWKCFAIRILSKALVETLVIPCCYSYRYITTRPSVDILMIQVEILAVPFPFVPVKTNPNKLGRYL